MAALLGRKVVFTWGGAEVLGIREKGLTVNGEPVDISSDEDDGWRTLLDEPGENSVDLSISGVTKDHAFINDLLAGTVQKAATLTWPNGALLSGTFHLASAGQTQPYKEGVTFEASLQSSGAVSYTPPS